MLESEKSILIGILENTGNEFRKLTWDEYMRWRQKDPENDFLESELCYFDDVVQYFINADSVELFSPDWKKFGGPLT